MCLLYIDWTKSLQFVFNKKEIFRDHIVHGSPPSAAFQGILLKVECSWMIGSQVLVPGGSWQWEA